MLEVLIVDNDEKMHIELPKLFSGALVSFKHSFTFQDAVIKLSQQEFSLLITDALVGELSGVELIKICAEYRSDTKVVIVTDDLQANSLKEELEGIQIVSKLSKPLQTDQVYKLFLDEFSVDPNEFLSSEARETHKINDNTPSSQDASAKQVSIDSMETSSERTNASKEDVDSTHSDSNSTTNDPLEKSTTNIKSSDSPSEAGTEVEVDKSSDPSSDIQTVDELAKQKKSAESHEVGRSQELSSDSELNASITVSEKIEEVLDDSSADDVVENVKDGPENRESIELAESEVSETDDTDLNSTDSLFEVEENAQIESLNEDLLKKDEQISDEDDTGSVESDELLYESESSTSFTESFGQESDDLTEQILYLDSLVSELEFVDDEIMESEVSDRVSAEVHIETTKERKERLEQAKSEIDDESDNEEEDSSSASEKQDTSIRYPEKKRPEDPYVMIVVSQDQLEARLVLYPHEEDFHSAGEIKKELDQAGVVFGVEHRRIAELIDQVNNDRKAALGEVVAKGQPAIAGKDAEILYEFSLEQPELVIVEDEFGRVDYKDIYQIDSVQEGDLVATLVPAEPPEDGTSVLGTAITGKPGMDTRVMNGKNCFFDEGDLRFYAEITGQPLLKNNKIVIVPIFTVAGDVDLSVGNVNFLGSIVVNGNINAGFTITAAEDIRVLGNVEGAYLKAGGEIAIKKGFIGGDKGELSAVKHITVKHCANGTMKCDGDILVEQYVLNSDVSCKGKLKSMTGKGCIIGGLNRAVKGIECLSLGSELGVHTNAIAGDNYLVAEMLKKINLYLKLFHERMKKIRKAIDIFTQRLSDKSHLKPKIQKLQQILKLLIQREQVLKTQKENLLKRLNMKCDAKIKVKNTVFPNVKIVVGNSILKINDALIGCAFSEDKYKSVIHLGSYE